MGNVFKSEEVSAFHQEFDEFVASPRDTRDIRPLIKAAAKCKYVQTFGPVMAVMTYGARGRRWAFLQQCGRFVAQYFLYKNRPLWNDYHMCLWLLSRERWAVEGLYRHLRRANRRGISGQAFTGDWMVASVCQRDPEFKAEWDRIIEMRGGWAKTPIGEFAASLGPDPAILERARMMHPEATTGGGPHA